MTIEGGARHDRRRPDLRVPRKAAIRSPRAAIHARLRRALEGRHVSDPGAPIEYHHRTRLRRLDRAAAAICGNQCPSMVTSVTGRVRSCLLRRADHERNAKQALLEYMAAFHVSARPSWTFPWIAQFSQSVPATRASRICRAPARDRARQTHRDHAQSRAADRSRTLRLIKAKAEQEGLRSPPSMTPDSWRRRVRMQHGHRDE